MKLRVKPLKGGEFLLDNVDVSVTVLQLKEMIEKEKGEKDFPVKSQKLIHGGKIMKDEQKLEEYNVKDDADGGFIVCMVSKKRPPAKKHEPVAATPPVQATETAQATTTPAATTPTPAPAVQIRDEDVQQLIAMGFVETDVRAALEAAFGNVARATEYLLGGIPEGTGAAPTQIGGANEDPLQRFRRHPQLNQLRQLVQTNPAAIHQVIQQIAQADPQLHAAIQADQDAFINLLNEPIPANAAQQGGIAPSPQELQQLLAAMGQMPPEQRNAFAAQLGMNAEQLQQVTEIMQQMPQEALQRMMGDMAGGALPPGLGGGGAPRQRLEDALHFTDAENAAVDRLSELGFSRTSCIQAYIACDKDENAAANLLFSNNFDEDDNTNA